jgi:hypothetical protein
VPKSSNFYDKLKYLTIFQLKSQSGFRKINIVIGYVIHLIPECCYFNVVNFENSLGKIDTYSRASFKVCLKF